MCGALTVHFAATIKHNVVAYILTAIALSQLQQAIEVTSILSTVASVLLMLYSGIQVCTMRGGGE